MHILFLDTASAEPVLILSTTEKVLVKRTLPKQGESHVIRELENALKNVGWRYEDHVNSQGKHVAGLSHIACVIGPGGFVSLRIGITVANVLSHLLGIPVAGVHLSELWRARVLRHGERRRTIAQKVSPFVSAQGDTNFLWLHSTRRAQLFIRGFGDYEKKYPEPVLIDLEEASKLEADYVGELLEEHKKVLPGCTPFPSSQLQVIEKTLPAFLAGLSYEKQQLLPWYGREA